MCAGEAHHHGEEDDAGESRRGPKADRRAAPSRGSARKRGDDPDAMMPIEGPLVSTHGGCRGSERTCQPVQTMLPAAGDHGRSSWDRRSPARVCVHSSTTHCSAPRTGQCQQPLPLPSASPLPRLPTMVLIRWKGRAKVAQMWSPNSGVLVKFSQFSHYTAPPRAHPSAGSPSGSAAPGLSQVPSTRSRGCSIIASEVILSPGWSPSLFALYC